ncbi:hypothetical protein L915_00651, partial [Phytophthora nicotianae]
MTIWKREYHDRGRRGLQGHTHGRHLAPHSQNRIHARHHLGQHLSMPKSTTASSKSTVKALR